MNIKVVVSVLFIASLWVGIFLGFKWLSQDEILSSESQTLLANVQMYDENLKQHPYFFALGFDAKAGVDPEQFGQQKYHLDWNYFNHHFFSVNDDHDYRTELRKQEGSFFTEKEKEFFTELNEKIKDGVLYDVFIQYQSQLEQQYKKQSLLNIRLQKFINLDNADRTLLIPVNGEIPRYGLIMRVHIIYLSHLAFQKDVESLHDYIELLIRKDKGALTILDKMIIEKMISQSLNLLNELNKRTSKKIEKVSELSLQHMSLELGLSNEVAYNYLIYHKLAQQSASKTMHELELKQIIHNKWLTDVLTPVLLLENMSTNQLTTYMMPVIQLSQRSNHDFKMSIKNEPIEPVLVQKIRMKNYLGHTLVSLSYSSWKSYILTPRLLNQKIEVFNTLRESRDHIDLAKLNQNQEGYEYYKTEQELCIKSLVDESELNERDRRNKSCLRI